jgi:hypothetical protein
LIQRFVEFGDAALLAGSQKIEEQIAPVVFY